MRTLLLTLAICINTLMFGQFDNLDINNVRARINADGYLFNNGPVSGFEVPKNTYRHTIFGSGLWFSGVDNGGQLRVAAQTYKQSGADFWPGPLDTMAVTIDSTTSASWNKVWKINRSTVDSCLAGSYGSAIPQSILDWPGRGDTTKNNAKNLAPYYDQNSNGIYDPAAGDCPCIKGDQAIFFIYNDVKPHTESGGNMLGLEIHGMAFAFNRPADTALNHTVFINYTVINRSSDTINNFRVGNWTDLDIGNSNDDYIGSDVSRGAYYGYNGDNYDETSSIYNGYHDTLPAQAVVFLQGPMVNIGGVDLPKTTANPASASGRSYGDGTGGNEQSGMASFMYYNNDFSVQGNPNLPGHYHNYMDAMWKDSGSLTYGGTGKGGATNARFMYPDTSDPLGYGTSGSSQPRWTEALTVSGTPPATPGDRRGVGAYGEATLMPGASHCISLAYVYASAKAGDSALVAVAKVKSAIDTVKNFFNARGLYECNCNPANTTGIGSQKNLKKEFVAGLYPNPVINTLNIKTNEANKPLLLQVFDITGQLVFSETFTGNNHNINVSNLASGVYIVRLSNNSQTSTMKFLKN